MACRRSYAPMLQSRGVSPRSRTRASMARVRPGFTLCAPGGSIRFFSRCERPAELPLVALEKKISKVAQDFVKTGIYTHGTASLDRRRETSYT